MPFDPAQCAAPLPRAYHWVDGSAYVNHVELVRKARGAEMPASFWTDPLVYQGGSDDLLGARDDVPFGDDSLGHRSRGRSRGDHRRRPHGHRRRTRPPATSNCSCWSTTGRCATSFRASSPRASASTSPSPRPRSRRWRSRPTSSARPGATARCTCRSSAASMAQDFGRPDAGVDMTFSFAQLIAHVTKTRRLGAGAIVGSGTVSNYDRSRGASCLAEKRTLEQLESRRAAHAVPAIRRPRLHRDARRATATSIFGALDNRVVRACVSSLANQRLPPVAGFEHAHQVRGLDARPGSRARHH